MSSAPAGDAGSPSRPGVTSPAAKNAAVPASAGTVTPPRGPSSPLPFLIALGLAAAWLLPLSRTWQIAPDLGHAWVAPLLMAYLYWERWDERPTLVARSAPAAPWWALAAALVLLHAAVRVFLTPFPLWPAPLVLLTTILAATALAAAALVAGRPGVRWLAGPLILVLAVLPAPTFVDLRLIGPLRAHLATLAAELCNLLGHPAIASGTSVRLAHNWVGIDEACGGIRSLQACLMIALFFGEWYRFSLLRRLALVLAGVAAALLGNGLRVLFLSLRADAGAAAVEASHDLAGWLAMGASLLLTGLLAARWAGWRLPSQSAPPRLPRLAAPAAPGWRWALVVVSGFLISEAAVRLWFARGAESRADIPQWTARLPVKQPGFRPEPLSSAAREMLGPDAFLAGTWPLERDRSAAAYYIEWHRGQSARTAPFLHNPTVCLPMSGCELVQTLPPLAVPSPAGELPFHAYKFRRLGEHILVAFTVWDPSRGQPLASGTVASFSSWFGARWSDVRAAREHQPAQLLAVSIPWHEDAPAQLRQLLGSIVQAAPSR